MARPMAMDISWSNLPSVVLLEVFSYLSHDEKIQASSTCKHWRFALFHPIFWQDAHFHFINKTDDENNSSRTKFLTSCFAKKLRNLTVTFDSMDPVCVQEIIKALQKICGNMHLRWLVLEPSHCTFNYPGRTKRLECEKYMKSKILRPLLQLVEESHSLEVLSIGCSEQLADNIKPLLDLLQQHQSCSLQRLALASVKACAEEYAMLELDTTCFSSFQNLQLLTVDYDYVSDNLLTSLGNNGGLLRFVIHVHGIDEFHPGTTNSAWASFSHLNPDCELRLNLIHSYEAIEVLHSHILQPAMPLSHLKLLFCDGINFTALQMLYESYEKCFRSLWLVESIESTASAQMEGELDPIVMTAWRCKKLEEIVILGYDYHYYDLIGIARIRGESLKRFDVSAESVFIADSWPPYPITPETSLEDVEREICLAMKRDWSFLSKDELHDVISCTRRRKIHPNEYIIPLLQLELKL